MKKVLLSLIMLTALVAFTTAQAEAADVAVTITVTRTLAVGLSETAWAIGEVAETATGINTQAYPLATALGTITATNNGNGPADLDITVDVTTGEGWTFADAAAADKFAMNMDKDGTPFSYTIPITVATGASLASGLAAAGTQLFDLELELPTSTTVGGTAQSFNITVTAS